MAGPDLDYLKPENLLKLAADPPLSEIEIGGRRYAIGIVGPEECARIDAIGTRLANGTASGEDLWPGHILKALLLAGDPHVDLASIREIPGEVIAKANREFMRQRVVAAVDPAKFVGRA